jgi:hypothetical protein
MRAKAARNGTAGGRSGRERQIEQKLISLYGFIIDAEVLWRLLCYPTYDAYQQAVRRGVFPFQLFTIPHRRGQFALASDVAMWLAESIDSKPGLNSPIAWPSESSPQTERAPQTGGKGRRA